MEELTKRNGKGIWMREIEKVLKIFDFSVKWLMGRIAIRDEDIYRIRRDSPDRRTREE